MDVVADFRAAPQGWPARPALDLTEDPAILTAIANDIGAEAIFARQVIAYGRPGDALLALSHERQLAQRHRGARRGAPARAGDDRAGRLRRRARRRRGARRPRRSSPARSTSRASRRRRRAPTTCCASWWSAGLGPRRAAAGRRAPAARAGARRGHRAGRRLPAVRLPAGGRARARPASCCNDERGVLLEVEGDAAGGRRASRRAWRADAPPLAAVERVAAEELAPRGERGFAIVESERRRRAGRARLARHRDVRGLPAELLRPGRPPLPLPVHQLHELRAALHDRPRRPLRPAADDDGRLRDVRRLPGRVRGPRATAASTPSPTRARPAARGCGCSAAGRPRRRGDPLRRGGRGAAAPGAIVAVKGLGGYHLACRADDEDAVAALRARKHREDKPFALMAPDLDAAARARRARRGRARRCCAGRERPIVLAPAPRRRARWRPRSRPARRDLGVMLPYTPLHHLLLADVGAPLVMTSGNVSDEPIAYRDDDALERLGGDRRPRSSPRPPDPHAHRRLGAARRGRAAADAAPLARLRPASIAAAGRGARARCSPAAPSSRARSAWPRARAPGSGHHIGDLETYETLRAFSEGIEHFERLFAVAPEVVAHDLHPDYLSTALRARARGRRARRRPAPPRPPRRVPGRARRDRAGGRARSSTAPGYGPDGTVVGRRAPRRRPRGLRARRAPAAGPPAGRRPRGARAVADGVRVARRGGRAEPGSRRRSPARSSRRRWRAVAELAAHGLRGAGDDERRAAVRRRRRALRDPRARSPTRARRRSSSRPLADPAERGAYELPLRRGARARRRGRRSSPWRATSPPASPVGVGRGALPPAGSPRRRRGACASPPAPRPRHASSSPAASSRTGCCSRARAAQPRARRAAGARARRLPPNDGGIAYGQAAVAAAASRT